MLHVKKWTQHKKLARKNSFAQVESQVKSHFPVACSMLLATWLMQSNVLAFGPWDQDSLTGYEKKNVGPAGPGKKKLEAGHIHPNSSYQHGAAAVTGRFMVIFFQKFISPQDGPSCQWTPTCSAYGKRAVERYGFLRGALMAADRLIRDNPFREPERDPVQ